jgi:hypothetical protein
MGVTQHWVLTERGDSATIVRAQPSSSTSGVSTVADAGDSFFSINNMEARVDPQSPDYRPYGELYMHWLTAQCTRYGHVGCAFQMADADLQTVKGAESAAACMLNVKFESIHVADQSMHICTYFDDDLYKDLEWQEMNNTRNTDCPEVTSMR